MNSSARSMASSTRSYLSPHRLAVEFDCIDTTMTRLSLCRKVALGALSATKNTTSVPETSFRSQQARRTASRTSEKLRCARWTSTRTLNSSPTGSRKSKWWQPTAKTHVYEVRPRADHSGVDLISDALPFGPLWYAGPNAISNSIKYAKFSSRSHDAVIRVFDGAGNVIETHEQTGDLFKLPTSASASPATPSSVPAKSASAETATTPPALDGGHGLVWVNTEKHVYHRAGSRFYGTTKKGKYVSEADAIKEGDRAAAKGQ